MERSESINELALALSKAQGEITGAIRDSTNPHFRSKYADLSSVWEAIRAPFSKHGLGIVQGLSSVDGGVSCETLLTHSSGQWISSSLTIPADKLNAHGYGSAATYARRFGLQAIAGIAPIDDDGNAAVESRPGPGREQIAKAKKCVQAIDQALLENRDQDALMEYQGAKTLGDEFVMSVWGDLGSSQRRRLKELGMAAQDPIKETV